MRRLGIIEETAGEPNGILEWEEVRIADSCGQTLLKIQTLTSAMKKLLDGEVECRHTCPDRGRGKNLELLHETGYGGLLINTGMYPILKRACLSLEAIRLRRIGEMQIEGEEQKQIEAIGKAHVGRKSRTIPLQDRKPPRKCRKARRTNENAI